MAAQNSHDSRLSISRLSLGRLRRTHDLAQRTVSRLAGLVVSATNTLAIGALLLIVTISRDPRWRLKAIITAFGAVCTGIVKIGFEIAGFTAGAQLIVLLVPVAVVIFFRVHQHHSAGR